MGWRALSAVGLRIWGVEHLSGLQGPGKDLITKGRPRGSWAELIKPLCEVQICPELIAMTHARALSFIPALAQLNVRLFSEEAVWDTLKLPLKLLSPHSHSEQHAILKIIRDSKPPLYSRSLPEFWNQSLSVIRDDRCSWKAVKGSRRVEVSRVKPPGSKIFWSCLSVNPKGTLILTPTSVVLCDCRGLIH